MTLEEACEAYPVLERVFHAFEARGGAEIEEVRASAREIEIDLAVGADQYELVIDEHCAQLLDRRSMRGATVRRPRSLHEQFEEIFGGGAAFRVEGIF